MASRSTYSHLSDPRPTGLQFLEQYADRLGQLFTAAIWPLASVGGTANAVTATCDPPLLAGLVEHMRFAITWAATNTSDMTLSIGGGTPVPVLAADGLAMVSGGAQAGSRALVEYVGSAFLIIGSRGAGGDADPYFAQITASATWTKPAGYADDARVIFEAWAGGGGGARGTASPDYPGGGGGGGGYARREMRYADVPSSTSITVGAGGPGRAASAGNGTAGGNTSIGTLLTAYGGAAARHNPSSGGGGGGELAAGAVNFGGQVGGGNSNNDAGTIWGGGGGGTGANGGGFAVYGGGGGGGGNSTATPGGTSKFGGNGGDGGDASPLPTAGQAPGGGGGGGEDVNGADGARGEVRIWIG